MIMIFKPFLCQMRKVIVGLREYFKKRLFMFISNKFQTTAWFRTSEMGLNKPL